MKHSKARVAILSLIVAFACICCAVLLIRIQHVNQSVQEATNYSFAIDQDATFSIQSPYASDCINIGDVTIEVAEAGLLDFDDLATRYPTSSVSDLGESEGDIKGAYVTCRATNNTSETITVPLYSFRLVSGIWRNGINPSYFESDNQDVGIAPSIAPKSSIEVTLCFDLLPSQFGKDQWANVSDRDYELLLSDFPDHCVVSLGKLKEEQ